MNKKLLIFDLDGTLCDTQLVLHTMIYATLRDSGVDVASVEEVVRSMEENGKNIIDLSSPIPSEYLPLVNRKKFAVDFWNNYEKYYMMSVDRVFDGMSETLRELKSRGYLLGVLSNKKNRFVQPIISAAFGEGFFDLVCGWDEVRPKKPDPTSLLDMLDELSVEKSDTWMIGDLSADYNVSVNAGVNHVIADWGYGEKKKFIKLGATIFAEKPLDLLEIFK